MSGLLGRLLPLFTGPRRVEDLFTEAVARVFERRPDLCLGWLEEAGLLAARRSPAPEGTWLRVSTQESLISLEHHDTDSRPDLLVEVVAPAPEAEVGETVAEAVVDAVVVESKIGSSEGRDQLRRYAEHLAARKGLGGRTLAYVTRAYDPKDQDKILAGLDDNVRFEQLRWHDFHRFLQGREKDALVEEVMLFMEEQGMATDHRFSATDLVALSGMPRAVQIMDETLDGEVRAELEAFAGSRSRMESIATFRRLGRYGTLAQLRGYDLFCLAGYHIGARDEYPWIQVHLQSQPRAEGREVVVAAMKKIALRGDWEEYSLDDQGSWGGVTRSRSLADFLAEEDHVAAVKRFLVGSIRQLREELTAFKEEYPELPWDGPQA